MRKLKNITAGISWLGLAAFIVTTGIDLGVACIGRCVNCFKA